MRMGIGEEKRWRGGDRARSNTKKIGRFGAPSIFICPSLKMLRHAVRMGIGQEKRRRGGGWARSNTKKIGRFGAPSTFISPSLKVQSHSTKTKASTNSHFMPRRRSWPGSSPTSIPYPSTAPTAAKNRSSATSRGPAILAPAARVWPPPPNWAQIGPTP